MIKAGAAVLLGLAVLVGGLVGYALWSDAARVGALRAAGYGDMTMRHASASPCRFGEDASAFLAQGSGKPEATGYVCVSPFRAPTIHLVELPRADRLDWH